MVISLFEVYDLSQESRILVACIVAALLEEQQSLDVTEDIHRSKGNRWGEAHRQRGSSGVNGR